MFSRPGGRHSSVRAVFLVGFMGAGKSSVGRALGERVGWPFEDLDDRIERHQGRSIAEIFHSSGEEEFRRAERAALREVLQELAKGGTRIVGLGGGAFVQTENAAQLHAPGVLTVFLDAPVEELWRRCVKQKEEPGLERPLRRSIKQFQALFVSRRQSYMKATLRIETQRRSIAAVAREIAKMLKLEEPTQKEGQPL